MNQQLYFSADYVPILQFPLDAKTFRDFALRGRRYILKDYDESYNLDQTPNRQIELIMEARYKLEGMIKSVVRGSADYLFDQIEDYELIDSLAVSLEHALERASSYLKSYDCLAFEITLRQLEKQPLNTLKHLAGHSAVVQRLLRQIKN